MTYLEHWGDSRPSSKHAKCPNLTRLVFETSLEAIMLKSNNLNNKSFIS